MKKLLFSVIISIIGFSTIQSQGISFGATGGLFYGSADFSGFDISSRMDILILLRRFPR